MKNLLRIILGAVYATGTFVLAIAVIFIIIYGLVAAVKETGVLVQNREEPKKSGVETKILTRYATDPLNGCQYVYIPGKEGITPRLGTNGRQICTRGVTE
jgi:hypothetical protein